MLTTGSGAARREAAEESIRLKSISPGLLKALIAATTDEDRKLRLAAVIALGRVNPTSDEAADALTRATHDPHQHVALYALLSLGRARALHAIPRLEQALDAEDEIVRAYAAEGLSEMGHRSAWPGLLSAAEDPSSTVFTHALFGVRSLVQPGDTEALEHLATRVIRRRRRKIERLIESLRDQEQ